MIGHRRNLACSYVSVSNIGHTATSGLHMTSGVIDGSSIGVAVERHVQICCDIA